MHRILSILELWSVCCCCYLYWETKTEPNQKHVIVYYLCGIFTSLVVSFYNTQFLPINISEVRSIHFFNYSPLFTRITSAPIDREITVKITLLSPIALEIVQHQLALLKSKFHLLKSYGTLKLKKCQTSIGSISLEQEITFLLTHESWIDSLLTLVSNLSCGKVSFVRVWDLIICAHS